MLLPFVGGHTAEILALLARFELNTYSPRRYIVADTDKMSGQKAIAFENSKAAATTKPPSKDDQPLETETKQTTINRRMKSEKTVPVDDNSSKHYSIVSIPRSREVGQSFRSSIYTTLRASTYAMYAVFSFRPELVLTNGPGTALPVVVAAVVGRILGLASTKIVYVESIARVKNLSLTGNILYQLRLTDEFLVQWEELVETHPRATYAGRLM